MKLSVSAWCLQKKLYRKDMDLLDFINYCHQNRIEHVELLDCFFEDNMESAIALLANHGMQVSAYSIGNDFVLAEAEARTAQIDYVISSIDIAVKLNTKFLRIFCGDVKDYITFTDAKNWILEALSITAKYAESKGIIMVLENHGFLAGKSEQVKEIIEKINSASLKSNSDVGNFLLVEESPVEALQNLKDHIGFIHLKDFKDMGSADSVYRSMSGKHYEGVVLGNGDVPLAEIVSYLDSIGYHGYLSIEYEGIEDPLYGTTESILFAKSLLNRGC